MKDESNRTINDEIQDMIDASIRYDVLYPCTGLVSHIWDDGFVNLTTDDYGLLLRVPVWGTPELLDKVLVVFKNNNPQGCFAVCDVTVLWERLLSLESRVSVLESLLFDE